MIRRLLATMLLLWSGGFFLFATFLPRPAGDMPTDGIVVLTGGSGRLTRGVMLLRRGRAERLLISGVDRRVTPADIAAAFHIPPTLMARVDLGRSAVDTRSNAAETARWIARHRYRSIRLVTSDWHMARARFELRRVMAGVKLLPDPVPGEPGLLMLVTEYNKYLLRRAAALAGQ